MIKRHLSDAAELIKSFTSYLGGWWSDGGRSDRSKVRGIFFGRTDGRTADKTRSKNFVLGSPVIFRYL